MAQAPRRVRVWDAPTRLVHWGIAICFGVSWWSIETHQMEWHLWSGYTLLALLLYRLFWGFFGSSTARFTSFLRGPREIWKHLSHLGSRQPSESLGHNALGALSVLAMLLLLLLQVGLGLFAVDVDGIESGPLSHRVDFDTGRTITEYHGIVFDVLQWLVGLHIVALLYYTFYKRDRLIGAMVTGSKPWQPEFERAAGGTRFAPFWMMVLGVLFAGGITWYIIS